VLFLAVQLAADGAQSGRLRRAVAKELSRLEQTGPHQRLESLLAPSLCKSWLLIQFSTPEQQRQPMRTENVVFVIFGSQPLSAVARKGKVCPNRQKFKFAGSAFLSTMWC
jgi:hypothetical protein